MEIAIIILGIIADRISKLWALKTLSFGKDIIIIKNFFQFSYLENTGAAFGIFRDKLLFLTILTSLVTIGLIVYLFKYKPSWILLRISLSMIISGAIGNLIDRIQYKYVVDFILLHFKDKYYFPTFNVADILVSVGAVFLTLFILKEESYGDKGIFSRE